MRQMRSGRAREALRRSAWFETMLTVLGYSTYVLSVGCLLAAIRLLLSIGDPEPDFSLAGEGFIKVFKGYGVGFFGVTAVVAFYVGQWLLEQRLKDERHTVAARYQAIRLATQLAQEKDFQQAGSWEWRQQVAYDLLPELREYAFSDDWMERRFALQTVKEAWEIYLRQEETTDKEAVR